MKETRIQLLRAFNQMGVTPHWKEWERNGPDVPAYIQGYGSPTILLDGVDIDQGLDNSDRSCRLYRTNENKLQGVPPLEKLIKCLVDLSADKITDNKVIKTPVGRYAIIPAVGIAFLPKLVCPACWPFYAGVLSAMGVSYVDYTPYLLPLILIFLFISMSSLVYKARLRRGYFPSFIGIVATVCILAGKFYLNNSTILYIGVMLLVWATAWNAWPTKTGDKACTTCRRKDAV